MKILLAAGADVNAKNRNCDTPLIAAALLGHTDCVKALLAAGADVKAKNNEGKTVADYVCANPEIAAALKAAGVVVPTADTAAPKPVPTPVTHVAPADSGSNTKNQYALAQAPASGSAKDSSKVLSDTLAMIGTQAGVNKLVLKPGDKVAFKRDSITAQGGYLRLANYIIEQKFPTIKPVFIGAGVSGQKAENMAPRFEKDMHLADKPAVTFISVGINDVWHRLNAPPSDEVLATYKANVEKMVDAGLAAGATVVLLTPTLIQEDATNDGNTRLLKYVEAEKQIAEAKKCKVIDLHAYFVSALAARPKGLPLTGDGVHMNVYGDSIMAIGVLRALGVSDTTIAAVDVTPILRMNAWRMSLNDAAKLLEVPPSRFFKLELMRMIGY